MYVKIHNNITLVFEKNTNFFAENYYHDIDPRSQKSRLARFSPLDME
jgi:hypothetical protein